MDSSIGTTESKGGMGEWALQSLRPADPGARHSRGLVKGACMAVILAALAPPVGSASPPRPPVPDPSPRRSSPGLKPDPAPGSTTRAVERSGPRPSSNDAAPPSVPPRHSEPNAAAKVAPHRRRNVKPKPEPTHKPVGFPFAPARLVGTVRAAASPPDARRALLAGLALAALSLASGSFLTLTALTRRRPAEGPG
jgi:hypothetical protein